MNYAMFEEIGRVPNIIRDLKAELIKIQFHYAFEKCSANKDYCRIGISTRGTFEQYSDIQSKLGCHVENIHNILTEEEIHLLGPDEHIETDYSLWYKNDNEILKE